MKKILLITILFFSSVNHIYADTTYFVDFKYILNKSDAGKKAQESLKKKLNDGISSLQSKEKTIQEEEKKIIQQKKVISAEKYKSQVTTLRKKVIDLQKERNDLISNVGDQRVKAKKILLKNLNPIMEEYMAKNSIRMIIDKKSILLADEKLDITDEITTLLNQKLKLIKLD